MFEQLIMVNEVDKNQIIFHELILIFIIFQDFRLVLGILIF
jgi:hypothetical protein